MCKTTQTGEFPAEGKREGWNSICISDGRWEGKTHRAGISPWIPLAWREIEWLCLCQTTKPQYIQTHFPVSVPIWWVSWPHDELHPLSVSSLHPKDAKGSGCDGWVTSTSQADLTPKPLLLITTTTPYTFWSSCHSSSISLQCCLHLLLLSPLLISQPFTFLDPSSSLWDLSHRFARNASLDIHSGLRPQFRQRDRPLTIPKPHQLPHQRTTLL